VSTLLEKQIKVNRIVTTSIDHAKAIEDPIRAKILEILYRRALTAEQISKELRKTGFKKALTTIRHHLDILKVTGLIEIVKIEETRGAITKYYGTSIKLLGFSVPENFESKYSPLIKSASKKLENLVKNMIKKTAKGKKQNSEKYSQYILMEIMNRALTNVFENNSSVNGKK